MATGNPIDASLSGGRSEEVVTDSFTETTTQIEEFVPVVEEVALKTAATRLDRINILWEVTQASLAISLTLAAIYISVKGSPESELLKNALFVVLGFYFGRTNHTRPVREVE